MVFFFFLTPHTSHLSLAPYTSHLPYREATRKSFCGTSVIMLAWRAGIDGCSWLGLG